MDDYYRILGVAPDARRDDVKAAYRARRDDLDAKDTGEARAESARLNRAWNVLSDPIQRDSYDDRLARARLEGAHEEGDSDGAAVVPRDDVVRPRRRRMFEPRDRDAAPQRPTIELPAGMRLAEPRPRLWAMGIDIAMLAVLFVSMMFYLAPALEQHRYPRQFDRLDVLNTKYDDARATAKKDDKAADAAESAADKAKTAHAADAAGKAKSATKAREASDAAADSVKRIKDDIYKVQDDMRGYSFLLQEGTFVLALLLLVVPSAREGQTFGKRMRRVRVLRETGERLGWTGSLMRYGIVILALNALWFMAGPLAVALILFVILGWMRNPNQQGMHDRIAKTIVVAAD